MLWRRTGPLLFLHFRKAFDMVSREAAMGSAHQHWCWWPLPILAAGHVQQGLCSSQDS